MGLNKQVLEMLSLATKENVILVDQKYYTQIDGVAMCSPLGPSLANTFLCNHKTAQNLSNQCIIKETVCPYHVTYAIRSQSTL